MAVASALIVAALLQVDASAVSEESKNRLVAEKSPYLRAHADDPVDWYPWGELAFAKAAREDKLVFLSSGYSACHWCHVMEHESFEDPEIARFLNERFVAVKLDREERPDVDALYLRYVVARTGSGGWPLTVILTPDRKPIFGGTYFPPRNVESRPGLLELLRVIDEEWRTNREEVVAAGDEAIDFLSRVAVPSPPEEWPADFVLRALESWVEIVAVANARPPRGPLFPMTTVIELAIEHGKATRDGAAFAAALARLDAMAAGGIRDPIGGGFARYSVDGEWRLPHFEKMLYVNALVARAYVLAFQATGKPRYERVARETLDFLLREMALPGGGFATSLDADSLDAGKNRVEGAYYTFTREEIEAALDPDLARIAITAFAISERGELDGRSVPRRPPDALADETRVEAARLALLALREERPRPARDEKVLVADNGLALSAFALAGRVFREPRYRSAANQIVEFLVPRVFSEDEARLARRYCDGETAHDGQLADYAFFASGLLDLYAVDFDVRHLELASAIATGMTTRFFDVEHGVFFDAPKDGESLPARSREGTDGSVPSPTAVAQSVLVRLARTTDRAELEDLAWRCLDAYVAEIRSAPLAHAEMLRAATWRSQRRKEVVFAGTRREAGFESLVDAWYAGVHPNVVVVHAPVADGARAAASIVATMIEGRYLAGGRAAAYLCEDRVCAAPIVDPQELVVREDDR